MKALFIGGYPNEVEPYRLVFFRDLIHSIADKGVECYVIAPVSITSYKHKVISINKERVETTSSGKKIHIYHPRIITYSAKKIGRWNTIHLTMKSIENSVIELFKRLNIDFDFVYGHFFLGGGLIASKIGSMFSVPAYVAYGEFNFEAEVSNKYGELTSEDVKGLSGIITVSSMNQKDIAQRAFAKGIPTLFSPNAIDRAKFHKKDKSLSRDKFGFEKETFIVGFVGYFTERKGVNRIIEATKGLEGVKLAFAGKGDQLPVGENVIFCKSLTHEDIPFFLNSIDVFVLPTLSEGCSNAIIEALSCGKAIITSNLPFNYDLLNNNNALLVDPFDLLEIRNAIIELRDNMKKRFSLENEALKTAETLGLETRSQRILDFINETSMKKKAFSN